MPLLKPFMFRWDFQPARSNLPLITTCRLPRLLQKVISTNHNNRYKLRWLWCVLIIVFCNSACLLQHQAPCEKLMTVRWCLRNRSMMVSRQHTAKKKKKRSWLQVNPRILDTTQTWWSWMEFDWWKSFIDTARNLSTELITKTKAYFEK